MSDVSIIISTNANQIGKEIKGMSGDIFGASAQAKALTSAMRFMDKAFNKGKISSTQYSAGIQSLDKAEDALYASIGKTTAAINQQKSSMVAASSVAKTTASVTSSAALAAQRLASSQRMAGKSTNKFGMYAQQVGYQVGDFNVQVQGGANALVAFGQQGTQLAGLIPGLGGAILGIGLSLATAFLRSKEQSENLSFSFKAMRDNIVGALGPIQPLLQGMGNALSFVANIAVTFGKTLSDNLARVTTYILVAATAFGVNFVRGVIAARLATITFAKSLIFLRGALIRTGIGALVVLAGELVFQFMRLTKAAGGFGAAIGLLKDVAVEFFYNMPSLIGLIPEAMNYASKAMVSFFSTGLVVMLEQFQDFTWSVARGLNSLFGGDIQGARIISDLGPNKDPYTEAALAASNAAYTAKFALEDALGAANMPTTALDKLLDVMSSLDGSGQVDPSSWFTEGNDKDKGKGSGGKDSTLEKLLEEQRRRAVLLNLSGQELLLKKEIFTVTDALGDEAANLSKTQIEALAKVNLALTEQETLSDKMLAKFQSIADTIESSMGDAMMGIVDGTMKAKDAFKSMASDIIKELYRVLVVQQMVGAFDNTTKTGSGIVGAIMGAFQADGGAWSKGSQIQAYANGGIVGGPTTFPMSGGKTGLMGEAGPEAIMPLKRGANGKLGVQMEGGGGDTINVVQNFSFQANGDDTVKRLIAQAAPKIAQMTKSSLLDDRRRGGSTKAAFG